MKKPKPEDYLFKHAPLAVRKLQKQSSQEQREKRRKEWKAKNDQSH